MTYRTVRNATDLTVRRHVISQTLENQQDNTGKLENSPINVNVDTGKDLRFKAHEWMPLDAKQESSGPILISQIPDMVLTQDVAMAPYDLSVHWIGDVTAYGLTQTPTGLTLDPATGILSGTPTSLSSTNPIADADGVQSNVFNISVAA